EIAALVVELVGADAANHFRRLMPRVDRDAGVAALLRAVHDAMEAARGVETRVAVSLVDANLLHAEHVSLLPAEPAEEALARGAAQTVRVEADDSQRKISVRFESKKDAV